MMQHAPGGFLCVHAGPLVALLITLLSSTPALSTPEAGL